MKNLLYLSYGAGLHEQEVIFSLLSAWRWTDPENSGLRLIVLTDRPQTYAGLPVTVEFIPPEQWDEWSGPARFKHRRKILALQHVFKKYPDATALLDGDTWLRVPPQTLFHRIGPGRAVMHLREGRLTEITTPLMNEMSAFLGRERFNFPGKKDTGIPPDSAIWNAGVIGMDLSDSGLLSEVLSLTDQFCAKSDLHILEQFAFSWILENRTRLQEAGDIVFHYWPPYLHVPFREKLSGVLAESSGLPLMQRAMKCYASRPQPTLARRGKVMLKRCLQAIGIIRGRARSNEW